MSRNKNRGPNIPHFIDPPPKVIMEPDGNQIAVREDRPEVAIAPRDPYSATEFIYTPGPMSKSIAEEMAAYINGFSISTGAALLSVHPLPANNSFLFIWEMP